MSVCVYVRECLCVNVSVSLYVRLRNKEKKELCEEQGHLAEQLVFSMVHKLQDESDLGIELHTSRSYLE